MSARAAPDLLPFNTEIEALLKDYATVYFDMSILNSVAPAETHEAELKRLINAGFGDRIMFGSDTRPAAPILRRLENIAWLPRSSAERSSTTTPLVFCASTRKPSPGITPLLLSQMSWRQSD